MYIQPQSVFKILSGVPFDSTYNHTILFENASQQITYFNSKVTHTFTDFTYVRKDNIVRVPLSADTIYQCNYCMFQNVGYGNKWFFGFITDIEYVNNAVSALSITIDNFQTWLFDVTLEKSFVEREHVSDDSVGANLEAEPVEIGHYVFNDSIAYYFTNWKLIILAYPNNNNVSGIILQNIYTGCDIYTLSGDNYTATKINETINLLTTGNNTIVGMYVVPDEFTNNSFLVDLNTGRGNDIQGYIPQNNKLFTFPYNFLKVTNSDGKSVDFLFEEMTSTAFRIYNSYLNGGECLAVPTTYKGAADNFYDGIGLSNFPKCSWSENSFNTWVANGGLVDAILGVMQGLSVSDRVSATGGAENNNINAPAPFARAFSAGRTIAQKQFEKQNVKGSSSGNLAVNNGKCGFRAFRMSVTYENAEIIDNYFTRFGYAVNRYKIPALKSRTTFNYIKTQECHVTGNAPSNAITSIENIYNTGITLWHTTDVGNYSLDNSIVRSDKNE